MTRRSQQRKRLLKPPKQNKLKLRLLPRLKKKPSRMKKLRRKLLLKKMPKQRQMPRQ